MGTPGYMAPEQARAAAGQPLGPTVDVYALGVLLYEMLCGAVPYRGSTALETVHLMLSSEPPKPSGKVRLPRDLEVICLKCLEKDPARRYASAAELADDLDRYLAGEPIHARPTPAWERAAKWARRQPLAAALACACLALAAVSFPLVTALWLRAESAQRGLQDELKASLRAKATAEAARLESDRMATRLRIEQSVQMCERGDAAAGLLWLDRAAEHAPPRAADLRRAARVLQAGWCQSLHRLVGYAEHPDLKPERVAYSADGRAVVTANRERVWLYDGHARPTGEARLPGHVVLLAGDGPGVIAVAASKKAVTLHRLPGAARVGAAVPVTSKVRSAALRGDRLLLGFQDGTAAVYDVATGKPVFGPWTHDETIPLGDEGAGRPEPAASAAFSPDGSWAAVAAGRVVRVWSARDGSAGLTFRGHPDRVVDVTFSPDGQEVLSGGEGHQALLWQPDTGVVAHRLPHEHGVCAVAFRPGGEVIATGSWDDTVQLWDRRTGRRVGAPIRHADDITALAFRPDGLRLATAGEDRTVRVWDVPAPVVARRTAEHPQRVNTFALSPDGRTLVTAGSDLLIRVWPTDRLAGPRVLAGIDMSVALAVSPDGTALAVGTVSGRLHRLRLPSGDPIGEPIVLPAAVNGVAWSPDGRTLA
ncbi:MAG: protein kinase domain-containing protein, partial [Gemmataceae bacterium]